MLKEKVRAKTKIMNLFTFMDRYSLLLNQKREAESINSVFMRTSGGNIIENTRAYFRRQVLGLDLLMIFPAKELGDLLQPQAVYNALAYNLLKVFSWHL